MMLLKYIINANKESTMICRNSKCVYNCYGIECGISHRIKINKFGKCISFEYNKISQTDNTTLNMILNNKEKT